MFGWCSWQLGGDTGRRAAAEDVTTLRGRCWMPLRVKKRPVERRKGGASQFQCTTVKGEGKEESSAQFGLRASLGSMTQAHSLRR